MFSRDFRLSLAKRLWKHSQGGVEVYCDLQNGGFSKSVGLMKHTTRNVSWRMNSLGSFGEYETKAIFVFNSYEDEIVSLNSGCVIGWNISTMKIE